MKGNSMFHPRRRPRRISGPRSGPASVSLAVTAGHHKVGVAKTTAARHRCCDEIPLSGEPDVIRVLIVDDHPFVRAGVLGVLNGVDDIEVVGECEDGTQVPGKASSLLPHVVLMDVRMPAKSGMEATRDLLTSQPSMRVVMLTGSLTGGSLHEAMQVGAVGYLLKGGPPNELLNAVRAVAAGGTAWPSGDAAPYAGLLWR